LIEGESPIIAALPVLVDDTNEPLPITARHGLGGCPKYGKHLGVFFSEKTVSP